MAFNVSDSDGDRKHYDPEIQENLNHEKKDNVSKNRQNCYLNNVTY